MRGVRNTSLVALCLFVAGGCQDAADLGPTGTISGVLTYQGEPLTPGTQIVFFNSKRGFAGVGHTDDQGHFTISFYRKTTGKTRQMPVGQYTVLVQPPADSGQEGSSADPSAGLLPGEMAAANRKSQFVQTEFPPKYRQPSTSGVTRKVVKGKNTFKIDLK